MRGIAKCGEQRKGEKPGGRTGQPERPFDRPGGDAFEGLGSGGVAGRRTGWRRNSRGTCCYSPVGPHIRDRRRRDAGGRFWRARRHGAASMSARRMLLGHASRYSFSSDARWRGLGPQPRAVSRTCGIGAGERRRRAVPPLQQPTGAGTRPGSRAKRGAFGPRGDDFPARDWWGPTSRADDGTRARRTRDAGLPRGGRFDPLAGPSTIVEATCTG